MREITQEEYKKHLLVVLKKIDEICTDLSIDYWIMYGTLIGAIRHKGYIPWDDDVDIALKREDYDKLVDYLIKNKDSLGPYYVDTYINNDKYPFYISRFCDSRVVLEFDEKDYSSGAFVDLYPFDGMGREADKEKYKDSFPQMVRLRKNNAMACSPSCFYGSSFVHKIGNLPKLLYCKNKGSRFFLDELDRVSRTYSWEESEYVGLTGWASYVVFLKKEWFDKSVRIPFESIEVSAPAEYDKILKAVYGDYMKLPPENERIATHGYKVYLLD